MLSEDTGKDLLDEMKLRELKHYNSQQVNKLNREIAAVDQKMEGLKQKAEDSGVTEELSINYAMLKAYKDRLVRILKSYHLNRFFKIEDNYFAKNDIKKLLNVSELNFHGEFTKISDEYFAGYKHLLLNDRSPPLNFYVQILTLVDCGIILSGNEFVDLKKDRIYFLKKADVTHLIQKNFAKII